VSWRVQGEVTLHRGAGELVRLAWRRPDGAVLEREVYRLPGVAIAICLQGGNLLMIRNYRPVFDEVMWELPGGDLEPGETPEQAALRELLEETGYRGRRATLLASVCASPGSTSEVYHYCRVEGAREGPAAPEADEAIEPVWMPLADAVGMARRGEVRNASAVVGIFLAAGG
jgi:ADP-ribose pyrophosphatase